MSISGVFEVSDDVSLIMNNSIDICKHQISYEKYALMKTYVVLLPIKNVLVSISSYEAIIRYLKHYSDLFKTSVFRYSKQNSLVINQHPIDAQKMITQNRTLTLHILLLFVVSLSYAVRSIKTRYEINPIYISQIHIYI